MQGHASPTGLRQTGIGLRQPHYAQLLQAPCELGFVEVHSENFFGEGGAALAVLEEARRHWDVSLHSVGLGLGSAAGIDAWHLERLARLVQRIEPVRVSDHACFARAACATQPGQATTLVHGCDLLPLAFTPASLDILCANVQQVQERLQRPILVENLSAYLAYTDDCMPEPEFLGTLARRTGCALLLDVNNLVVNALNHGQADPVAAACTWIQALPADCVGEIHLAGFSEPAPGALVIDDHSTRVREPVWRVFCQALARFGVQPTLIEWDLDLPDLDILLAEAQTAERYIEQGLPVHSRMAADTQSNKADVR